MTQRIPLVQYGSGSDELDALYGRIDERFGMVPNFFKTIANNPAVVKGFAALYGALGDGTLTAAEREIIALEVSRRQASIYAWTAHAAFARRFGVSEATIKAIDTGEEVAEPRHEVIRNAASALIDSHGKLPDADFEAFREAGLDNAALLEVSAVVGAFTFVTVAANLAQIEIDEELAGTG